MCVPKVGMWCLGAKINHGAVVALCYEVVAGLLSSGYNVVAMWLFVVGNTRNGGC